MPFLSEVNHSSTFLLSFYLTKKKCLKHKLKNKIKRVQLNNILRLGNERLDGEEPSPGHQQQHNEHGRPYEREEQAEPQTSRIEDQKNSFGHIDEDDVLWFDLYLPTKWKSKGIVDAANEPMWLSVLQGAF